jgi:hypothetical protein
MPNAAPVTATVTLVDKVLDAASGTFRVRMRLPNRDGSVPAGLRCKVEFNGVAQGEIPKATNGGNAAMTVVPKSAPKGRSASRQVRQQDATRGM